MNQMLALGVRIGVAGAMVLVGGCAAAPTKVETGAGADTPSETTSYAVAAFAGMASAPLVAGGVVVIADDGFPSDLWRFDLGEGAAAAADATAMPGRLVNPPVPVFFASLAAVGDDDVLLVGVDCSGASVPEPDDEPRCEGPVVAQRYDPAADTWQVLKGAVAPGGVTTFRGVDSGAGSVVAVVSSASGRTVVEVDGDGKAVEVAAPDLAGFDGGADATVRLCPGAAGAVAYAGTITDVAEPGTAAAAYSSASRTWSSAVPLGADLATGMGGVTVCTGDGIAVLGHPATPDGPAPSVLFIDGGWVRAQAPPLALRHVAAPDLGVFFDGRLSSVDRAGWHDTDVVAADVVGACRIDAEHIAVVMQEDVPGNAPTLHIARG